MISDHISKLKQSKAFNNHILSIFYKLYLYFKYSKYYINNIKIDNYFILDNFFMYYNDCNGGKNIFSKYFKYIIKDDSLSIYNNNNDIIFRIYIKVNKFYIQLYDIKLNRMYSFAINNDNMIKYVFNDYRYDILSIIIMNSLYNVLEIKGGLSKWIISIHIDLIVKRRMNSLKSYL